MELDSVGATGETILSQLIKYDSVGNKVSLEEVSKKNILATKSEQYEYDKESRITKLVSNGVTEKFFYDTLGNRIQKEIYDPSNKKNPLVVSRYVYNNRNQLITSQGIGEEVAGHMTDDLVKYTYDTRGNLTKIETAEGTVGQYYFDATNKMTASMNKMGTISLYTYDGAGRRVKQSLDASNINVPEKAALHVQPELSSVLGLDRSESESSKIKSNNGIGYGSKKNIRNSKAKSNNGKGNSKNKSNNGNGKGNSADTGSNGKYSFKLKKEINYVVDATSMYNNVLMTYGLATETQRYTYGNDLISIATWHEKVDSWSRVGTKKFDKQLYYVQDSIGSTRALVKESGHIVAYYDYDIFGVPVERNHIEDQGIKSNIYHYGGYIYDYVTSLYFVNARYYMPETGRFISEDIYKDSNRYVYVKSNPLKYTDPSGYACGEEVNKILNIVQLGLDILGVIPVMGETADGLNTILSFLRGNVLDGIFSAISMIPGFGDAVAKPVKGILGALGNSKVIKSFVSGLTKFFGSANKAVSGINKVASTIKNLIKQVPKAIKSMKAKLKDTLGSWLSKKINKSLDKVAEFFSKSSDKIVKELDEGVKEVNESIIKFDLQQFASKGTGKTVDVNIHSSRYSETTQHIKDAQKAGHPDVLTIDRPNTNMRRKESLKDQPVVKGMDRDEYPPAMFKEGGTGASVRPISPSDNRGAGSFIGNKLRGVPDGTKVRIKVD